MQKNSFHENGLDVLIFILKFFVPIFLRKTGVRITIFHVFLKQLNVSYFLC